VEFELKGKTVLVTGGTGSFGNFIIHRLLQEEIEVIRVLSRDEKKQYDMKIHFNNHPKLNFFIGDIRDHSRVNTIMNGVNIVFQAAALKHVPVCEHNPSESVKTNIIGVENVINAALKEKVEKFISISTDKAVKPVNVMGMSKAIQERLTINANRSSDNNGTIFSCIRYGNVMSSRGSVIPFFRDKLLNDEELTITDIDMTRFLLTLGDAIDLVMFALFNAKGGEIFVKKSPSFKVLDLAKVLSESFGKKLSYRLIGKYPGEKIHETLISEEELQRTQDMEDFFKINPWWDNEIYNDLTKEYVSSKELIFDEQIIRDLIRRSDKEMDIVSFEGKEFAKF
jgi:UDP-glucose 4-epimerase